MGRYRSGGVGRAMRDARAPARIVRWDSFLLGKCKMPVITAKVTNLVVTAYKKNGPEAKSLRTKSKIGVYI